MSFLLFSPTARQHHGGVWAGQGGDEHTGWVMMNTDRVLMNTQDLQVGLYSSQDVL